MFNKVVENDHSCVEVDSQTGAVVSVRLRKLGIDLIDEPRLGRGFRLCVPTEGDLSNYVESVEQAPPSIDVSPGVIRITHRGLLSKHGPLPIDVTCTIELRDDAVVFRSTVSNRSKDKISEFWYPRLGGLSGFGSSRTGRIDSPSTGCLIESREVFKKFPGSQGLGAEAAEFSLDYPGSNAMPWWDLYDPSSDHGVYLGYHDDICRYSTWHLFLHPTASGDSSDQWLAEKDAAGRPVGLIFSHVRYPFMAPGETFDSGEFVLRPHAGDWHVSSKFYRQWFTSRFPLPTEPDWIRRKSIWFTSILYQPEDRIVADYVKYNQWTRDAEKYGIDCHELIGWDKGGLERDYPEYVPEPKLGGVAGFQKLLESISARGSKCLVFVNYNVLDTCTELYRSQLKHLTHQDYFGNTPNWMNWGEGTLLARKGIGARRHVIASVVPEFEKLIEKYFMQLAEHGAEGFQIDKLCVSHMLDFNPLNTLKPDVALCEGVVVAIKRLLHRMRSIRPDFAFASESILDRLIPYISVFYRCATGSQISTLRYVFPEWTSCTHIWSPRDFNGVNGALLSGAVLCIEPDMYQNTIADALWSDMAQYLAGVTRIRTALASLIFLGHFQDTLGASVTSTFTITPRYAVYTEPSTGRRAIVVINENAGPIEVRWSFEGSISDQATLHSPFTTDRVVTSLELIQIMPKRFIVIVEHRGEQYP